MQEKNEKEMKQNARHLPVTIFQDLLTQTHFGLVTFREFRVRRETGISDLRDLHVLEHLQGEERMR